MVPKAIHATHNSSPSKFHGATVFLKFCDHPRKVQKPLSGCLGFRNLSRQLCEHPSKELSLPAAPETWVPHPLLVTTGLPALPGAPTPSSVQPSSKVCPALRPPAPCVCLKADRVRAPSTPRLTATYGSPLRLSSLRESEGQPEGHRPNF